MTTVFIPADVVLSAVSEHTGIPRSALRTGRQGYWHVQESRRLLWASLREIGWSYPAIGEFCDGRHHSTIQKGLRAYPPDPANVRIVLEMAQER